MKKMRFLIHTAMLMVMLFAALPMQAAAAQPSAQEVDRSAPYVPGEVLIGFGGEVPAKEYLARADALAADVGAMVTRKYSNFAVLNFSPDTDVFAMAQQLSGAAGVVIAQPNYVYWTPEDEQEVLGGALVAGGYTASSSDGGQVGFTWDELAAMQSTYSGKASPVFPTELTAGYAWGWDAVQADLIWPDRTRNPDVCVLDTGVDMKHYDLSGKVVNGFDFYNGDKYSYDDNGHGTHVAGIISAKLNNDKTSPTAAGVSAARVYAIKVLNAQAMGTTFSVASGLINCANLTSVSVINMSFGSTAKDPMVFTALKYAAYTKGKLIVAAAGNETSSAPLYPAAYSNDAYDPDGEPNTISGSVISVAAAAAPAVSDSALQVWVDKDGGDDVDADELYDPQDCAYGGRAETGAYGTNYGNWVTIVAPGEDILSATPTSYPFYENYYGGVQPGYDYMSGSSMATAFVSGAASRMWFTLTFPQNLSPALETKIKLVSSGAPLQYAVDKNISDASAGFNSAYTGVRPNPESGAALAYGVPYTRTGSGDTDTVMAPYCWPGWMVAPGGNWTEAQNMMTAPNGAPTYLNVAKAMGRGAAIMEIKDASNGQGLPKVTAMAYQQPNTLRDKAVTVVGNSRAILINLPAASAGTNYDLRISNSAYTAGTQTVNRVTVYPGQIDNDVYSVVSLAPKANINFVLDWNNADANLDMYLRLPKTGPFYPLTTEGGIVGPLGGNKLTDYVSGLYDNIYLGPGTMLAPKNYIPGWTTTNTTKSPYAQHYIDGGLTVGSDGLAQILSPAEWISVFKGPQYGYGYTDAPIPVKFTGYRPYYAALGDYDLYVTDYSAYYGGYQQMDGELGPRYYLNASGDDFVYPVVRVWQDGILVKTIKAVDGTSCSGDNDWWKVMSIPSSPSNWSAAAPVNTCSDGTQIQPGDLLTYP